MANQNQQHNAAGMPFVFRLGIVVIAAYLFAWAFDNVVQPQQAHAPATPTAREFLRNAIQTVDAKIWK